MSYPYDTPGLSYARGCTDVRSILLVGQSDWTVIMRGTLKYQPNGEWMGVSPVATFSCQIRTGTETTSTLRGPVSSLVAIRGGGEGN